MISVTKPEDLHDVRIVIPKPKPPSYEEKLERVIQIVDGKLRNSNINEAGYVRVVCHNDSSEFSNDIRKIYLAAGWSKVKISFKDNGVRDPNPVTTVVLHK